MVKLVDVELVANTRFKETRIIVGLDLQVWVPVLGPWVSS